MSPQKITQLKVDFTAEKNLKITGLSRKKTLWITGIPGKWDRDPERLQVRPRDPGPEIPKCFGRTWVLVSQNIQVEPGTWDPESGNREPKIFKWNLGLPIFYSFNPLFYTYFTLHLLQNFPLICL